MKNRYLYGKSIYLEPIYRVGAPIRFTDIYHFEELENEAIKDNEKIKRLVFPSQHVKKLTIGQIELGPHNLTGDLTLSLPTARCHVLCLSNKKNDPELFHRFKADVCLELRVDDLLRVIRETYANIGVRVIARDVEYCPINPSVSSINKEDLVFSKSKERFEVEAEYRVAIFFPTNSMKHTDGSDIKIFWHQHFIEVGFDGHGRMQNFIESATDCEGRLVFQNGTRPKIVVCR